MTKRARLMVAALESGPKTRPELYAFAGKFYLTNNSAAEARAAGYDVACELVDGEYTYRLLGERHDETGALPVVSLAEPPALAEGAGTRLEREPSRATSPSANAGLRALDGRHAPPLVPLVESPMVEEPSGQFALIEGQAA